MEIDWLQDGKPLVENRISVSLFKRVGLYEINLNVKIGALTDYNMWDQALTYDEMVTWTACKWEILSKSSTIKLLQLSRHRQFTFGNYLNWATSEWTLLQMNSVELTRDEFCSKHKPFDVPMTGMRDFTSSRQVCRQYGGNMTVVTSVENQDELFRDERYQQKITENPKQRKKYLPSGSRNCRLSDVIYFFKSNLKN
jgi:hypothetical protein